MSRKSILGIAVALSLQTLSAFPQAPAEAPVKRAVMEEFTGLGCGFCVRGIVGIRKCEESFGDRFIAIARHTYQGTPDSLLASNYDYYISGGFPKSIINRHYNTDPGPDEAPYIVSGMLDEDCAADVSVEACFPTGGDGKTIVARAVARFASARDDADYRFGFALVEDSVKGYTQTNYYYHNPRVTMGGFEKMDKYVKINLDHVARLGYGVGQGIENSVPVKVGPSEPVVCEVSFGVPAKVTDKSRLRVVALLIDRTTGYIDNAAETPYVAEGTLSGIINIGESAPVPDVEIVDGRVVAEGFGGRIEVYTADGMRVPGRLVKRGVYVVRLADGGKTAVRRVVY